MLKKIEPFKTKKIIKARVRNNATLRQKRLAPWYKKPKFWLNLQPLIFLVAFAMSSYPEKIWDTTNHAWHNWLTSHGFIVKTVQIHGNQRIPNTFFDKFKTKYTSQSMAKLDIHTVVENLKTQPWVKELIVKQKFPNQLVVHIVEHKPYAYFEHDKKQYFIVADGKKIATKAKPVDKLPRFMGEGAAEKAEGLLKKLQLFPNFLDKCDTFVRVHGYRWNIYLKNGMYIKLRDKNFAEGIKQFYKLQAQLPMLSQQVDYVDLRNPQNVILGTKKA